MRVGYFGGSFDPPHRGHLVVARAARDQFGLQRVLLAPTGRQPLKPNGPVASFADRLAMTQLLCDGEAGLEASALEAPRLDGRPNYTLDTLQKLSASLPGVGTEVFAIVGADAFAGLPQWHGGSSLVDLAEWIVVNRPGYALQPHEAWHLSVAQQARIHPLQGVEEAVSATLLRARLRSGEPCDSLLTAPVLAYIQRHGLYQS